MASQKVGRGGAGNFLKPTDVTNTSSRVVSDIEAQIPVEEPVDQTTTPTPSSHNSVAHMGRGGAGNTFKPSAAGTFSSSVDGTASAIPAVPLTKGPVGRGGVGNYQADNKSKSSSEIKRAEAERQRLREEVSKLVDSGLAPPEKAVHGRKNNVQT